MKKEQIVQAALEAGFMISTMHGEDENKLMPVSDTKTLLSFYNLAKRLENEQSS